MCSFDTYICGHPRSGETPRSWVDVPCRGLRTRQRLAKRKNVDGIPTPKTKTNDEKNIFYTAHQMDQPGKAEDNGWMKKLDDKSPNKAIKSCLKSNIHGDRVVKRHSHHQYQYPFPRRVEFRRTRTEREYECDRHDKSRKWYNVSRKMSFVVVDMPGRTSATSLAVVRQHP
jgi:hypothetical protein